jgi:DNA polymerase-3 subunit alpha
LEGALQQEPRLKELVETDPRINELMTVARSLEGLARHASTHAAGVVISQEPLTDHVPLYKGANDEIVTQYSMTDVEKIGLVKFDFLGLKTLTMIHHAVRMINERKTREQAPPLDIWLWTIRRRTNFSPLGGRSGSSSWKAPACVICWSALCPHTLKT